MANKVLDNESFTPRGLEIILYNHQEAKRWREGQNNIIAAEPLSWWKPNEVVEETTSERNRKRGTFSELEVEKEKEFSLTELYKSNNKDEIILEKEKGEFVLDPQELLDNLKGWTTEKRKRQKLVNGKYVRVDKVYRHPRSKRILRSLVEVKKFIEDNSCIRKASDNGEGASQLLQRNLKEPVNLQDAQSNMYFQLYKRLEETLHNGAQLTSNIPSWSQHWEDIRVPNTAQGTTFKSHNTVDISPHSVRPLPYQASSFGSVKNHKQVEFLQKRTSNANIQEQGRIYEKLKEQVSSDLVRSDEPSPCYVSAATSSSTNIASLYDLKMMVQAQVEAQIQARVAEQVVKKISEYEKTQREMVEKMDSMHRLLVFRGLLPPSQ